MFEDWVEYEIYVLLLHTEKDLLKDMSPVRIESEIDNVVPDPFFEFKFFIWHVNHFYQALHAMSAFLVARDLEDVWSQSIKHLVSLR